MNFVHAASTAVNTQQTGIDFTSFIPLILVFTVIYFFIFRPQQQKEQKRLNMISTLKKGDTIVLNSGLIASIVKINDDDIVIEFSESVTAVCLKSAINSKINKKLPEKQKKRNEQKITKNDNTKEEKDNENISLLEEKNQQEENELASGA